MIRTLSYTRNRLKRLFLVFKKRAKYLDDYELTEALQQDSPYTRLNRINITTQYNTYMRDVNQAIKLGKKGTHQLNIDKELQGYMKSLSRITSGGRNFPMQKMAQTTIRQMRDDYISTLPKGYKTQFLCYVEVHGLFSNYDFWRSYFQSEEGRKQFNQESFNYNEDTYIEMLASGGGAFTDEFDISPQLMLLQSFYTNSYADLTQPSYVDLVKNSEYTPNTSILKQDIKGHEVIIWNTKRKK